MIRSGARGREPQGWSVAAARRDSSTAGALWLWVALPALLPDRMPLLLVLAGPIRWVVAGVALAAALPIGPRLIALIPAEPQMPGRKTVFVSSLVLYLFFGVNSSRD